MKKCILAIVLCLSMLCSVACENTLAEQVQILGETDGAVVTSAPVVVLENSFTFTSLLPSESFMEKYGFTEDTFGWLNVYMENDLIYGIVPVLEGELETKVGVVVFDANGNILSEEERIFPISKMRAVYCLEDGGAICIYDISVTPKICRTDAENTILYEGEVTRDGNRFSIAVSEDSIALAHGISLYIYNNAIQPQNTYTCPVEIKDLYWGEDGFLYGQTIQHDMMRIDPASGNSRPVYPYMVGEYGKYLGGGEYDLYVLKGDGLYGVKADENGELTEKCEPVMLMDSGVNLIDTPYLWDLWILDADSMVIKYVDETYNATANPYYFLKRTEPLPREVVTVGCCNAGSEIRSLVLQYNRMQSEKFVQLIDYGDPRQGEESLQEKIFDNMENGTNPDLFIFTDQYESVYLNLSKQGYLADLAVFSEILTASAAASVTRGTTMDRIPYYIAYNTLITTTGKQDVTAENLAEEEKNIQNEAFLFGGVKDAYKYLLKNMESLFVDPLTQ
ncbi:MAG: hypothetical protein IKJ54_04145, partial [Anaerotignum sp.]|nr:hypothetical protein [Anaerotignum sp.]